MLRISCTERLPFLSASHKAELNRQFQNPDETAMPHEIAVRLGLSYADALLILSILQADKLCSMKLLIYHYCAEPPVDALPFGQGFPNLPWFCPHCEEVVNSYDELSFDVMAKTSDTITFVE